MTAVTLWPRRTGLNGLAPAVTPPDLNAFVHGLCKISRPLEGLICTKAGAAKPSDPKTGARGHNIANAVGRADNSLLLKSIGEAKSRSPVFPGLVDLSTWIPSYA